MKNILLFLLLFIVLHSHSQTESKWQFGMEFSLDYLSNVDFLAIEEESEFGYSIDFNKTNYSFGITSRHSLNQEFMISSGILYSNKDFSGTLDCNDPCEFVAINSPELLKQRFINIPMSLIYKISDTKIKPHIEIGINNNIEIDNEVVAESNSYFLEGFIGASFLYQFNTNWNLGLGYKYQTALTNLYKSETPGLGARITSEEITARYVGKKLFGGSGDLLSVSMLKGENNPAGALDEHHIDGMSGATLTANGMNDMFENYFGYYKSYIEKSRKSSGEKVASLY